MVELLSEVEIRVLGCLMEKEMATPEYYPMTLNALTAACNQRSNRHPVVLFDEKTVARGLERLKDKGLARVLHLAGSRVPKYEHRLREVLGLEAAGAAVLCELMLRGPQTLGELRSRASRLHELPSVGDVERILEALSEPAREDPVLVKLPRQAGRKEHRYAQLLGGPPDALDEGLPAPEAAAVQVREENERIKALEEDVETLREELRELRKTLAEFRSQFE